MFSLARVTCCGTVYEEAENGSGETARSAIEAESEPMGTILSLDVFASKLAW